MEENRRRRPSRNSRRRRAARRRQMAALIVSATALLVVIIVVVAALKGCGSSKKNSTDATTAVASGETYNSESTGTANQSENSGATEASSQTGTVGGADTTTQSESDSSTTANATQESSAAQTPASDSNTNSGSTGTVSLGVTSKGYKIEQIDGVTYVDGVLIANKTYSLPSTFIPTNPEVPVTENKSTTSLDKDLMSAWRSLQSAATANGLNIYISSGYRSYSYQVLVYNTYVSQDGVALADTYSSRPGNSEHQTGLCFDLNSINDSFAATAEGKWVNDNCYKYGFCIRFPKGKDSYTGYQYESWHLRYVGVDLATKLYNNGDWLSLEEYFGITSVYPD